MEVKPGRGIAACSHILTTDSTPPLSPLPWRPVRDVTVGGFSSARIILPLPWLREPEPAFQRSHARLNLSQSWDYPRGLLVLLLWMRLIAFQRAADFISLNVRLWSEALEVAGRRRLTTLTRLKHPTEAQTCRSSPCDSLCDEAQRCAQLISGGFRTFTYVEILKPWSWKTEIKTESSETKS